MPADQPDPAETVAVTEECGRLLDLLGNECLRQVAVAKLEGYTNREIGEKVDLCEKTIERKLRPSRRTWKERGAEAEK